MDTDFSPLETLQVALRRWWLVVGFILAGAAFGGLFFRLGQPQYEARSAITFSIDYSRSGILTDEEVDRTLEAAGDILASAQVMQRVVASANSQGLNIDAAVLQRIVTRERTASAWVIRVRHPDPSTAALLANLVSNYGLDLLTRASRHALTADALARYQASLESCLASSVAYGPAQPLCAQSSLGALLVEIQAAGDELQRERLASQGILAGLSFTQTEEALPAAAPIRFGQGSLIFAGMVIGAVIAIFVIQSRVFDRVTRSRYV